MEYVAIVIVITLIEYIIFSILVGRARVKYNCPAPLISGNPVFERYYRVHQNTMEQLVVFLPAIVLYGYYGNPVIAAVVGLIFPVARVVYLLTYVSNPDKRGWGFLPGFLAIFYLLIAGLVAAASSVM
ncbi:MAG: MAPEG family protein [Gammaproteobacteria bacterium]|nr:MAPEG family protein [Gammaproteobacteria bacterium]MCY4357504.1 MAPEG family protein [Gammaproteobacteria bacterium]